MSERYVADHLAPLIASHRPDAASSISSFEGSHSRPTTWEHANPVSSFATGAASTMRRSTISSVTRVGSPQPFRRTTMTTRSSGRPNESGYASSFKVLEGRGLLTRRDRGDGPREIVMLRDLGDRQPFDDPGAKANYRSYVTILGSVLAAPIFRTWGSRELVGFLCATVGDRYACNQQKRAHGVDLVAGSAVWYRQADWFNNENGYRPAGHVALPFSTTTIERGLKAMRDRHYIIGHRKKKAPDGKRFQHPRMIYTNRFHLVGAGAEVIDLPTWIKSA